MLEKVLLFDNIGRHFLLTLKLNYCSDKILKMIPSLFLFYFNCCYKDDLNFKSLGIILTNDVYSFISSLNI